MAKAAKAKIINNRRNISNGEPSAENENGGVGGVWLKIFSENGSGLEAYRNQRKCESSAEISRDESKENGVWQY
jgi:hypothetical protein